MKILILGNSILGLYKFRKEIVIAFLKEGNEVYISTPRNNNIYVEKLEKLGAKFIETDIDRRGINPLKDIGLIKNYIKIIKDIKPGIILGYTIKPNIYGSIVAQFLNVKHINNITGLGTSFQKNNILSKFLKILYKVSFRKSKCVFFQNEENRDFFIKNNLIKNKKHILIPGSGVNLEEFYPLEKTIKKDKTSILFIGRVMKEKGIVEYLETAKAIVEFGYNVNFEIVGSWEEKAWEEKVMDYEKKGYVKFLGFSSDVREQIRNTDIVVNPSYHEGMSNILLESGAMGKVLLASNISGCKEIIPNRSMLFEKANIESIIGKIKKVLNMSKIEQEKIVQEQRKYIKENFDRNLIIEKYIEVIKEER